ncbi:MAG: NADH-quinone oxidoreductase subunit N [Ignavibacterium sp.]
MINYSQELIKLLPLLIIGSGILFSLLIEMFSQKSEKILPWLSIIIFLFVSYYSLITINERATLFNSMIEIGGNVNIFYFIFNFGATIIILLSFDYIKKTGINFGEYYILIQSAVLGMMLLSSSKDLIMIFIGLEQMSICFYILAGFKRKRLSSNEASLKYFLLGSFATGFIVYGIALIYGSAQSMSIKIIVENFPNLISNYIFITGFVLFIIGFTFKIAAFPFHMWVPDVYQGSPTTITALMSTTGKTAAFSALIIAFTPIILGATKNIFEPVIAVLATLSMLYGSIVAIVQKDIKRMLAYSSIAHAGYMLIGLASGTFQGVSGIIFYLIAYTFMNIGAFGIISMIEGNNETNLDIQSYAGLGYTKPLPAALLSIFMFALAGIPPFAGFFGKYYVFVSAIQSNLTWLAIIGIIASAISVYFYLYLVVVMYFQKSENNSSLNPENLQFKLSGLSMLGVIIVALLVILMGVFPGPIIELISSFPL